MTSGSGVSQLQGKRETKSTTMTLKATMTLTMLPLLASVAASSAHAPPEWSGGGFFDLAELESTTYEVNIRRVPISLDAAERDREPHPSGEGDRRITVLNKYGQKYSCLIPGVGGPPTLDGQQRNDDDPDDAVLSRFDEIFASMAESECFTTTQDWWTYKLCYGQQIQQYHLGHDGEIEGDIISLGRYSERQDSLDDRAKKASVNKYLSVYYTNGTECDITGLPRKAEIRFFCDPSLVHDTVLRIDEFYSCVYVVSVSTPRVCELPEFVQEEPLELLCAPLLSPAVFDKWSDVQKVKKEMAEEAKISAKERARRSMLKLLEEQDLGDIDVNSEEGMETIEGMVVDKIADKVYVSLRNYLGALDGPFPPKKFQSTAPAAPLTAPNSGRGGDPEGAAPPPPFHRVEEVVLPNGLMQSRLRVDMGRVNNGREQRGATVDLDAGAAFSKLLRDSLKTAAGIIESSVRLLGQPDLVGHDEASKTKLKAEMVSKAEEDRKQVRKMLTDFLDLISKHKISNDGVQLAFEELVKTALVITGDAQDEESADTEEVDQEEKSATQHLAEISEEIQKSFEAIAMSESAPRIAKNLEAALQQRLSQHMALLKPSSFRGTRQLQIRLITPATLQAFDEDPEDPEDLLFGHVENDMDDDDEDHDNDNSKVAIGPPDSVRGSLVRDVLDLEGAARTSDGDIHSMMQNEGILHNFMVGDEEALKAIKKQRASQLGYESVINLQVLEKEEQVLNRKWKIRQDSAAFHPNSASPGRVPKDSEQGRGGSEE